MFNSYDPKCGPNGELIYPPPRPHPDAAVVRARASFEVRAVAAAERSVSELCARVWAFEDKLFWPNLD